jgi:phosphatidate cytidylyltransferase
MTSAPTQGRSLSKSVTIGLLLGALFLASILFYKEAFIGVAALAAAAGSWELATALRVRGWWVQRWPVTIGSLVIMPAAYYGGPYWQWITALAIVGALIASRFVVLLIHPRPGGNKIGDLLRDFATAAFVVIYLPLTTSFTVLLLRRPDDGKMLVLTLVVTVAMIDTFGYLIGRRLGRHKMAPGVSPKKSIEGLVASIVAGATSALLFTIFGLGQPWWLGVILAGVILLAAVFGDLAESLIKRDLGIKDMSSWLPGHGGVMDRIDSILPSALVTYLFAIFFLS